MILRAHVYYGGINEVKKIITSLLIIVCYCFVGIQYAFAQDYIDYSDYIAYEDIQTLDIQPLVNDNSPFHYYHYADYRYITSDKNIIMDFLNELFPLVVADKENEQQLKYAICIQDAEFLNAIFVTQYSNVIYRKNGEWDYGGPCIADAETYEKVCEKYIPLMETEQIEKNPCIGGHGDPDPSDTLILACSEWAIDYILDAYYKGAITYTDVFTEIIDREYFCEVLYNLLNNLGYTNSISGTSSFEDIDSETVNVLVSMGIIKGRNEKIFAPDDNITREEIAVIINRSMEYMNIASESNDFIYEDDGDISEWAKESVYKLAGSGIMNGDGTRFEPHSNSSKEQAIAALMRLYYIITGNN
jgi:hypothetical protein